MSEHRFLLDLRDAVLTDDLLNGLFEAGCDDATFAGEGTRWAADFTREADTFADAVGTAISQLERAVPGLRVRRVVLDDAEDLVTASEIGRRADMSREAIRLLANGERGDGSFPAPTRVLDGGQRLWDWLEVATWFARRTTPLTLPSDAHGYVLRAFNSALDLRAASAQVGATERQAIMGVVREAAEILA